MGEGQGAEYCVWYAAICVVLKKSISLSLRKNSSRGYLGPGGGGTGGGCLAAVYRYLLALEPYGRETERKRVAEPECCTM